VKQRCPASHWN